MKASSYRGRTTVVAFETVMRVIFRLPRFGLFDDAKSWFLRAMGASVGKGCTFYPDVWITTGRGLVLGDDVDIALGVLITTDGGVSIGDRTLVGYGAKILSSNHEIPPIGQRIIDSGHKPAPVEIGQDCWIGANAIILPGVNIGTGTIVGAGSVVTSDISPNTIAAGVPAKVIRERE